jgi:hypothetical protein
MTILHNQTSAMKGNDGRKSTRSIRREIEIKLKFELVHCRVDKREGGWDAAYSGSWW